MKVWKVTGDFNRIKLIDVLLLLDAAAAVVYVYGFNPERTLKIALGIVLLAAACFLAVRFMPQIPARQGMAGISRLALLDEEGKAVREWRLDGRTSLLIGKSASPGEVDINLFEAEYASLISKQHAVLNFVAGRWFVEDIHSRNGVGIKRSKQKQRRLEVEEPYPVESGDIIYIANTRLLVQ